MDRTDRNICPSTIAKTMVPNSTTTHSVGVAAGVLYPPAEGVAVALTTDGVPGILEGGAMPVTLEGVATHDELELPDDDALLLLLLVEKLVLT